MSLPNSLIVGAAKSGTTSLFDYLCQHPDIYVRPCIEPSYFSDGRPVMARCREDITRLESPLERDPKVWYDGSDAPGALPTAIPGVHKAAGPSPATSEARAAYT